MMCINEVSQEGDTDCFLSQVRHMTFQMKIPYTAQLILNSTELVIKTLSSMA